MASPLQSQLKILAPYLGQCTVRYFYEQTYVKRSQARNFMVGAM